MEKITKETKGKKVDTKYDNHIEIRFHKAKKAIIPQLDAVIKVNLNLNEVCDELCAKYELDASTFKGWVNDQVPSILHVEADDNVDLDDVDDKEHSVD